MITVIKKNKEKKKKEKDKEKKNGCPTRLERGTFIPTLRIYHKATRALLPYYCKKLKFK